MRPVGLSTTNSNYKISIHALTGSATKKRVTYGIQNNNFNPRTHGECDIYHDNILWLNLIISIHAPARGATKNLFGEEQSEKISIHAPARGATYA